MNDSDKFQQLGLDDLEEGSGGEALSDRAVAALPKAVPGGICPYCGMKIAVSLYGTAFTNDHERFGFSNATVWQCNKSDLDYTLFRE